MTNKELAELMYPNCKLTIEDLEKKYPERNLKEGAIVSRYAPSPTGFVHMGNMLSCFIENFLPQKTGGVFYLRIEDTDQKREVEGGIENIINSIKALGIEINEGVVSPTEQKGDYGPYIQSQRKDIYEVFAKHMIENDLAYPCFCTADELHETREFQMNNKLRIGYYGDYAKCRNLTNEERAEKIKAGVPYTIRLKSRGDFNKKLRFKDLVKGEVVFPENDMDIILIKSDGIPVYHFAHLVDDHLMHTTHVLRGEDWLSSIPVHIELFNMFGFKQPKYAHLGLVMIVDENGTRRKISKRKDVDFTTMNYAKEGFPAKAMQEYLITIANTSFEAWRQANPREPLTSFDFSFSKVGSSPLFDYNKLVNLSRSYMSYLTKDELYEEATTWAKDFDKELYDILTEDKEYTLNVLNIEREKKKPRKDYAKYSDIKTLTWYMFPKLYDGMKKEYEYQTINDKNEIKEIVSDYFDNYYNPEDDHDTWFERLKELSEKMGYTSNLKEYREDPSKFKGSITDVATVIRVAITTKSQTPDLYEILHVLGLEEVKRRVELIKKD